MELQVVVVQPVAPNARRVAAVAVGVERGAAEHQRSDEVGFERRLERQGLAAAGRRDVEHGGKDLAPSLELPGWRNRRCLEGAHRDRLGHTRTDLIKINNNEWCLTFAQAS